MDTEPAPHHHLRTTPVGGPLDHLHVEAITASTPGANHEGFLVIGPADEADARRQMAGHPSFLGGKTIITLRRAEDGCFYGLLGDL